MVEIDISEMEEKDENFWDSVVGRRELRRVKRMQEFSSESEARDYAKEKFTPEWWTNIEEDGELGRAVNGEFGEIHQLEDRSDMIGSVHWHSVKEKARASEGDKLNFMLGQLYNPEKNKIRCVHAEEETCCYGFKDFDREKLGSKSARKMFDEGVDEGIIDKKCKAKGTIRID